MSDNENTWTIVKAKAKTTGRVAAAVPQHQQVAASARALERKADEGNLVKKRLDPGSKQALIAARLAAKWTQDQADAACAFLKHTFKGIEAGKILPDAAHLRAISRTLKVDLKLIV